MANLWFITGVSSGLGRAVAIAAIDAGYDVVGSVRNAADAASFEALATDRAYSVLLDVADHGAIGPAIDRIERDIGPIGVVVNNAGYGQEGPLEQIGIGDMRRLFDANFFGALAVSQAVIPHMRVRGRGLIINISSITALGAAPAIGAYSSSKAALNCASEVLAKEVAPFGIKVTAIQPGSFRTDWAGRSLVRGVDDDPAYAHLDEQRAARAARDGRQVGDPAKFARALIALAQDDDPPANLLLGESALRAYRARIAQMEGELARCADIALTTDFDPIAAE